MSNIIVRQLVNPTDAQLEEAVQVCTRSFHDIILTRITCGTDTELASLQWRALLRAGLYSGEVYVASDNSVEGGEERIMSVAIWWGPGKIAMGTSEDKALGWNEFWEKMTPETREWYANVYGAKAKESMMTAMPVQTQIDCHWARVLATDPAYQRRGLCTAIIEQVATKAKAKGEILGLATVNEENAAYYRGVGFRETGRIDVPSSEGVFPIIWMLRD